MDRLLGRRFLYGVIGMVCVTITTIMLNFDAESYIKLVGTISALFLGSQTLTDAAKIKKEVNNPA